MKILRLSTNYPAYLARFVDRHGGLEELGYARQHAALMADRFAWSDSWTYALAPLGVEMWEPVANFESAQRSWAREHGLAWDERNWRLSVSAAQVRAFRPDVLLVDDYGTFTAEFVRELRTRTPSIACVAYWCGAPLHDLDAIAPADLVLSNLPGLVDYLNRAGKRAVHFRHAFDPRIVAEAGPAQGKRFGLTFAGSLVLRAHYHLRRAEALDALANSIDIQVLSEIDLAEAPEHPPGRLQRVLGPLLKLRGYVMETHNQRAAALEIERRMAQGLVGPRLASKVAAPVFGLEMYRVLRDSIATLNVHLDFYGESAANMRLFEATGVGCCLLTDWKYDLAEQFAPDQEVVAFESAAECVEKARYLLDHPAEAAAIGLAGQKRTLAEHTFEKRAPELVRVFKGAM